MLKDSRKVAKNNLQIDLKSLKSLFWFENQLAPGGCWQSKSVLNQSKDILFRRMASTLFMSYLHWAVWFLSKIYLMKNNMFSSTPANKVCFICDSKFHMGTCNI